MSPHPIDQWLELALFIMLAGGWLASCWMFPFSHRWLSNVLGKSALAVVGVLVLIGWSAALRFLCRAPDFIDDHATDALPGIGASLVGLCLLGFLARSFAGLGAPNKSSLPPNGAPPGAAPRRTISQERAAP